MTLPTSVFSRSKSEFDNNSEIGVGRNRKRSAREGVLDLAEQQKVGQKSMDDEDVGVPRDIEMKVFGTMRFAIGNQIDKARDGFVVMEILLDRERGEWLREVS